MINLMLDGGLPYHVIIDELGENVQGLNPQGLAKWVQSGYEVISTSAVKSACLCGN